VWLPKSASRWLTRSAPPPSALTPLTRREFYQLAEQCRTYAAELAHHDQTGVHLAQCHKFNAWLPEVKSYDRLAPLLATLQPARPIARWQVMTLAATLGFLLFALLSARGVRQAAGFYAYLFALFLFYFVPERLYGTTVELLEGKVLRVVDALDQVLAQGDLEFSEAAFFQVKENLQAARRELREQIDLAHRR
jgi:hypothetical protein